MSGVGRSESPPRAASCGQRPEERTSKEHQSPPTVTSSPGETPPRVPPILTLPPEVLANVLEMLAPVEVVSASCAHPDWAEIANRLVLVPRGHLRVHLGDDAGDAARGGVHVRLLPAVHTLHLVGSAPRGVDDAAVRAALSALARTLPLGTVHSVWLHEDDVTDTDVVYRTDASQRSALDAILEHCPGVNSINFSNVKQSAGFVRHVVDSGPRPHLRSSFLFAEHNHHVTAVLGALDELGAFFEETTVTVRRPELSVTASFPHYWEPRNEFRLPYGDQVRSLCVSGAGLAAAAYRGLAPMPALRELRLCDANGLGDDALLALAAGVRRLRSLAVHDAPGVSEAAWTAALRAPGLRRLQSLEVGGCPDLDDEALGPLKDTDALEELVDVALDLEGCTRGTGASGDTVDAIARLCPNVECLTLTAPFSPSLVAALERAPPRLPRLRRLTVRVQGSGGFDWTVDPKEAIAGVDHLKRRLRAVCPPAVRMDVSLTFIKLGMAVSSSSDDEH